MRSPSTAWEAAIDTLAEQACVLVEILAGGTTLHRLAIHDADVPWNDETWTATEGSFSCSLRAQAAPEGTLNVDNTDKAWNDRLAGDTDYHNAKVIVRVVDLGALGSADNVITDYWWIKQWSPDEQWVSFKLSLQVGLLAKRLPGRTYGDYCPWVFKGSLCGYTGASPRCSKRLEGKYGCRENFGASADKRFGGFPNRPSHLVVGVL